MGKKKGYRKLYRWGIGLLSLVAVWIAPVPIAMITERQFFFPSGVSPLFIIFPPYPIFSIMFMGFIALVGMECYMYATESEHRSYFKTFMGGIPEEISSTLEFYGLKSKSGGKKK